MSKISVLLLFFKKKFYNVVIIKKICIFALAYFEMRAWRVTSHDNNV